MSKDEQIPGQIRSLKRFNRLYSKAIEEMERDLTPELSHAEMQALYEIAYQPTLTAKQLALNLSLDTGYLSRLLAKMQERGLITRSRAAHDGRNQPIELAEHGRDLFLKLDAAANERIGGVLQQLTPARRRRLVNAVREVGQVMETRGETAPPFMFRPPKPGDLGWIIYRHGTVIADEFGWDEQFEHMVVGIVADFMQQFNASYDRCIIAEHDGEVVGSIFLVRHDDTTAKLRLLYVEPHMRGQGLGKKLVEKVIREARKIGYSKVMLWTSRGLDSAHRIYESAGFTLVDESANTKFTSSKLDTLGQTWELDLAVSASTAA